MKRVFLTIIIVLFISDVALSQQQVLSGLNIDKAVTWSGTVIVEGDITVGKKGRLTIEAGTKVLFAPQTDKTSGGKDKTRSELIVKGSIIIKGEMDRKVTFTSNAKKPRMGDWYGIYIGNPKQIAIIDNAIIEFGYNGIVVKNSNPVIRNSRISLNYNAGILCEVKSQPKVNKNVISENGYGGIICGLGAKPILSDNLISLNEIGVVVLSLSQPNLGNLKKGKDYNLGQNFISDNSEYDLYNHTKLPIYAENNSWGSSGSLADRIYDSGDDAQYGVVDALPIYKKANLDELIFIAQENTQQASPETAETNEPVAEVQNPEAQQVTAAGQNKGEKSAQKPVLAENTPPTLPAGNNADQNSNKQPVQEEKKNEAQEIAVSTPPVNTSMETERPLATLEQKPAKPQINYDQIFMENFLDARKKIIKKVPPKINTFGPKGRVIIRAIVGKDGRVEQADIVRGLNDNYDEISLEAAKQFQFTTGEVKGVPVRYYTNIFFEF